jgi:DNA-binding MarR family transcriptional regulator
MKLQKRDYHLLNTLCEFGLLSTKQLGSIFFKDVAITTVLKRLRILEAEGLIKRVPGLESFELLWVINNKGAKLVEQENYKTSWNKQMLEHDYKISSLRLSFLRFKLYESWTPEHKIKSLLYKKYTFKGAVKKLIPDGLMTIKRNNNLETWAIEMELSLKAKDRYERIFREYGKKENVSGIWYFAKGESIFKLLKEAYKKNGYLLNGKTFVISYVDDVLLNLFDSKLFYSTKVELLSNFFGVQNLQLAQGATHPMSNYNFQSINQESLLTYRHHTSIPQIKK